MLRKAIKYKIHCKYNRTLKAQDECELPVA
jgi:hypothetical protein